MTDKTLGDYELKLSTFKEIDLVQFQTEEFQSLNSYDKHAKINLYLTDLIRSTPKPCFLLAAVVDFIDKICTEKIILRFNFQSYELWLNQFSGLTPDENLEIRAAIMGKRVPRDAYQVFFPIGMDKSFDGTHFVTAHASPDLDTTVASFWGWVDAFAARVGKGLHAWNLPGGSPNAQVEIDQLFFKQFGNNVFKHLAKTGLSLTLSSYDLMTQQGLIKKLLSEPALSVDHERNQNAIVLIDQEGYYIGDWRNIDVEGVRQVIMSLYTCLSWFENNLHMRLISLFAQKDLHLNDIPAFMEKVVKCKLGECTPAKEFAPKQRQALEDYFQKVLGLSQGLNATFQELAKALEDKKFATFEDFTLAIKKFMSTDLFDKQGKLKEDRPLIFAHLENIVKELEASMRSIQSYVEKLQAAFQIKTEVFGFKPSYLSHRDELAEIEAKMASYPYLTVNYLGDKGRHVPVGIIPSTTLRKPTLGTVTLRDFSNREETKIPPYLEVISVIDHHKTELTTKAPPMLLICDAQSCNALVAELTFQINDRYSTGGMSSEQIATQLKHLASQEATSARLRLQRRLLKRQMAHLSAGTYIDVKREYLEYLQFLHAILDDTDLLTKVSQRDVRVTAELLNRLKSLMLSQEVETVHFDDIPQGPNYTKACAKRLLTNPDLHALYSKIYLQRETHVDQEIDRLANNEPSILFEDTKIQNNCARVGQTKIFSDNYPTLSKHIDSLRATWLANAQAVYKEHPAIPLHMQMITTIASAEELFSGRELAYSHQDEIWIWIPGSELSVANLKAFLTAFRASPQASYIQEIEFLGPNAPELSQIFKESFLPIPHTITEKNLPIAVLHYTAGTINSRKAMITPYLPSK
ncbi:MAG: hypothetical protein H7A39_02175 [Chlamydiales bacterium]|nr:hypothetical protein [Chlamydiales bacterium]